MRIANKGRQVASGKRNQRHSPSRDSAQCSLPRICRAAVAVAVIGHHGATSDMNVSSSFLHLLKLVVIWLEKESSP